LDIPVPIAAHRRKYTHIGLTHRPDDLIVLHGSSLPAKNLGLPYQARVFFPESFAKSASARKRCGEGSQLYRVSLCARGTARKRPLEHSRANLRATAGCWRPHRSQPSRATGGEDGAMASRNPRCELGLLLIHRWTPCWPRGRPQAGAWRRRYRPAAPPAGPPGGGRSRHGREPAHKREEGEEPGRVGHGGAADDPPPTPPAYSPEGSRHSWRGARGKSRSPLSHGVGAYPSPVPLAPALRGPRPGKPPLTHCTCRIATSHRTVARAGCPAGLAFFGPRECMWSGPRTRVKQEPRIWPQEGRDKERTYYVHPPNGTVISERIRGNPPKLEAQGRSK